MSRKYKVGEISKITGVKEGTVRLYEKCGFLEPVDRLPNGYRSFNEHHIFQVRVCDLVFDSFVNRRLRKCSMKLIEAARDWDLDRYKSELEEYRCAIRTDIERTSKAIAIATDRDHRSDDSGDLYTKKEAAKILGTTPESIRNWERNGLIPQSEAYAKRYYSSSVLDRMYVIRLLLDTGYGIMAILRFFDKMDAGDPDEAARELTDPKGDDLQSKADYYLKALHKILGDADKLEDLLSEI